MPSQPELAKMLIENEKRLNEKYKAVQHDKRGFQAWQSYLAFINKQDQGDTHIHTHASHAQLMVPCEVLTMPSSPTLTVLALSVGNYCACKSPGLASTHRKRSSPSWRRVHVHRFPLKSCARRALYREGGATL